MADTTPSPAEITIEGKLEIIKRDVARMMKWPEDSFRVWFDEALNMVRVTPPSEVR